MEPDAEARLTQALPCGDPPLQPCQALGNAVNRVDGDLSSTRSDDGRGRVPVNVAVLDGGIDLDHPDLNVVGGKDCFSSGSFDDRDGHGTMVAGLIGALDNSIGRVGVAPGARLWAVRVARPNGFIPNSRLLCGIDFVTATRTDSDPRNDIAVANLSLSGPIDEQRDGDCGTSFAAPVAAGTVALCLDTACRGMAPREVIRKIVADARAYNRANPGYGYDGDPLRPFSGRWYGWLIRAGLY